MVEIVPCWGVDGAMKIETYPLRAKSPKPPMPFWIRDPITWVELTLP